MVAGVAVVLRTRSVERGPLGKGLAVRWRRGRGRGQIEDRRGQDVGAPGGGGGLGGLGGLGGGGMRLPLPRTGAGMGVGGTVLIAIVLAILSLPELWAAATARTTEPARPRLPRFPALLTRTPSSWTSSASSVPS